MPAFEDPAEWILKEGSLPENVTPENSRLEDPEERHRIARVFERGLTTPSGYVLPVQRWQAKATGHGWRSERWKLRRGHLFLVPGDSPTGYRLPLGALPFVPPSQYPYINPADPTEPRGDLPEFSAPDAEERAQPMAHFTAAEKVQERIEQTAGGVDGAVRTALSVEARDGRLCVFMPPVEKVEDYLELVAASEAAAPRSGCRSTSRAMPRRTIRASTSSVSPRTRACSRSTSIPRRAGRSASRPPRRSTRRRARSGSAPTSS